MLAILATLFTLYTTPQTCQAPCYVRWMALAANEQPKGELCAQIIDSTSNPGIIIHNSCRTLYGDEKSKFFSGEWKNVEKGSYIIQIILDDKLVSERRSIIVSGGLSDRED